MGLESRCSLVHGRTTVEGKALLESDHILFRGDGERTKVMLGELSGSDVKDATLVLTRPSGVLRLVLPDGVAAKWLARIRNPRLLMDKLGVTIDARVAVIGIDDATFTAQLRERTEDVVELPHGKRDLIFFGAESSAELARLASFKERIMPDGAIWVVHRKGKEATLKDVEVFAAARAAGLVDTKVASFSATHTAEKLVVPLEDRP